jgi:tetratricopeptide (TPR) repeat protein
MAKKLNTKVAVIGIILIVCVIGGGAGLLVYRHIQHDPERALVKGREALAAGDYKKAESYLGRAYAFGKTDEYQIERLFELAEFHLIQNAEHEADWGKALGCWKKIITNNPQNIEARRKLLDFYFQAADAGDSRLWKDVHDNTKEIMDVLKAQNKEPDNSLLKAHARALLSMANRGETTNQRELLQESMKSLTLLAEKDPQDEEIYLLLAEAASLEGRLGQLSGVINAVEKSQEKAMEWLNTGIEKADDKSAATANLFLFKRQMLANDPNQLKTLRAEVEQSIKKIQPNDTFWLVTSTLYEIPTDAAPEAELNRAIEAIREALAIKPQNVEYTLRMARLLYRKGMAFNDPDAIQDSIELASGALSLPDTQDIPGPLNSRNRSYRFALNTFLADAYLEQALSRPAADTAPLIEKAERQIAQINSFLGSTTDNPIAEKYAGLLELAKGETDKGIRLLYKTYERTKALDKPGESSNVDPFLCVALARVMKEKNLLGPQREFLETALRNNTPIILQNPQLLLDYAEIMEQLGSWNSISELAGSYQNRYGVTERSLRLLITAATGQNKFEEAQKLLSSANVLPPAVVLELKLQLAAQQAASVQRASASDTSIEKTSLTAEQTAKLNQFRKQREDLMEQMLRTYPESVKSQTLTAICGDMMRNGQTAKAAAFLDLYLPSHPDMLNLRVLRAQLDMEDPMNISREQTVALQERIYNQLDDPKTKALALSQLYRSLNRHEDSLKALSQLTGADAGDVAVLQERFEIALEKQDTAEAEKLLASLRTKNADGCEGALFNAQVEMLKKNYPLALRRLDECLTLKPLDSTARFLKSQIYQQQEDYESASQNALKAVQMAPQNPVYARNLASILFARNTALGSKVTVEQRNEAERAIAMAMFLNPAEWQLQSVYAESIQLQAPDRALLIRQRLLETYPNASNAVMLGNMALRMAQSEWDAAKKTGLFELAGKSYEKAITLEPDYQPGLQAYADFQQMMGNADKAVELLKGDENMLWKFYLRNGQFDKAEQILIGMLEKTPSDPILLRGMIIAAEGMGNRTQLKEYLDKLGKADESKETELLILQKYLDSGFSAEAEQKLTGFKERYPDEKAALLIEAWTQMTRGRLDEAMSLTNRYLETDTNHGGAWRLRGRLYRLMNQPLKAIDDLQRSKSLADNSAVRIELATVYLEAQQISAAIGELVSGLENPQAPIQMRLMLERLYQQNNQTVNLEKLYAETLSKYPQSVFWHSRAGRYLLDRGQLAAAQPLLQKAWDLSLQQGAGDITALFNNLDCLYQSQKYDDAFSLASGLIDSPFAPVAYAYMGQIQAKKTQKDKAVESFSKALDKAGTNEVLQDVILTKMIDGVGEESVNQWISRTLAADPSSVPAHLLASRLAQRKGLYNKAIEPIDQCLSTVEKNDPAWIGFAMKKANLMIMAYAKTADRTYLSQSISLFTTILEKQPDNPSLLNNLAYLLADNDQDLNKALECARKAHQQDPGNAVYLDTYALVQCKTGDYQKAEQNLLRSVQLYEVMQQDVPWDLYKHLGMAREGLGKTQQAIDSYRQALDTAADSLGSKKQAIPESEKQKLQQSIQKLQQF